MASTTLSPASTARMLGLRETLGQGARHPATWAWLIVYGLAALALLVAGDGARLVESLASLLPLLVLTTLTIAFTTGTPPRVNASSREGRTRLWLQIGALCVVILLTLYAGLSLNNPALPLPFVASIAALYRGAGVPRTFLLNPLLYFVAPTALLRLLGARLRQLHLGPGWRRWRITGLWALLPVAVSVFRIVIGAVSPSIVARQLVGNTLQNGFFEEFLFRGALMSRLRLLFDGGWAIMLSSLVFGVWHIGADLREAQGNLLVALALTIIKQGMTGVIFAIIVYRTRNLLASSVFHVLLNTTGF